MSGKKRVRAVDIARGIAILSIIMGHCGSVEVEIITFTYHVPIFVLLSGYFLNINNSWKEFITGKIRSLLIPYLVTSLVIIILQYFNGFITGGAFQALASALDWSRAALYGAGVDVTSPVTVGHIGVIWFLLALFWGSIFTRAVLELPKQSQPFAVGLFYLVSIWLAPVLKLPFSLNQGFNFVFFLYIGRICRQYYPLYQGLSVNVKGLLTFIALLGWIDFLQNYRGFFLGETLFFRGFSDVLESLCACYLLMQVSVFLETRLRHLSYGLEFLGANSLALMCFHCIELDLYPWLGYIQWIQSMTSVPIVLQLTMGVTQILADVFLTWIFYHFNWFRKLFNLKKIEKPWKQKSLLQAL